MITLEIKDAIVKEYQTTNITIKNICKRDGYKYDTIRKLINKCKKRTFENIPEKKTKITPKEEIRELYKLKTNRAEIQRALKVSRWMVDCVIREYNKEKIAAETAELLKRIKPISILLEEIPKSAFEKYLPRKYLIDPRHRGEHIDRF